MGTGKKEASRKVRQGKVDDGMANVRMKGENFYRWVFKVKQSKWKAHKTHTFLIQRCQEDQDLEHVQGWQGSTQRRG